MNQAKIKNTHDENRLRLPAISLTARSGGLVETARGGRIILFGEICERKKRKILDKASISFWDISVFNETLDRLYAEWTHYIFLFAFFSDDNAGI